MRTTMFEQSSVQKINGVFLKHFQNLQRIIDGTPKNLLPEYIPDPDAGNTVLTLKCAVEALNIIKNIDDERTPLFTKPQINALLCIPAITADWQILLMHLNMKDLSLDRQEQLADFLIEVTRDRSQEKWNLCFESISESYRDFLLKRLNKETDLLQSLRCMISTIKNPIPEFSEITVLLNNLKSSILYEEAEFVFKRIRPVIANAENPRLALRQALRYSDKINAPIAYINVLKEHNKDEESFNQFLNSYKSNASSIPKYH